MASPLDLDLSIYYTHNASHSMNQSHHHLSPPVHWNTVDPFNTTPSPRVDQDPEAPSFDCHSIMLPAFDYNPNYTHFHPQKQQQQQPLPLPVFFSSDSESSFYDQSFATNYSHNAQLGHYYDDQDQLESDISFTRNSSTVSYSSHSSRSTSAKRVCDSRLSLHQLSLVLGLDGDVKETISREKLILDVFKFNLNFPLGEKTWIRDTPINDRVRFIRELHAICESKYHFGYNKEIYNTIIRRASYSLMQGRLRRERRSRRKLSS